MINEWKKGFSSLRSFFTPFNFYTSIKFLTASNTATLWNWKFFARLFSLLRSLTLGLLMCLLYRNKVGQFLGDSNLIGLLFWCTRKELGHPRTILAIFSLFNQASSTKWKLSALDSQIGFSFLNSAMKVSLYSSTRSKLWMKEASVLNFQTRLFYSLWVQS